MDQNLHILRKDIEALLVSNATVAAEVRELRSDLKHVFNSLRDMKVRLAAAEADIRESRVNTRWMTRIGGGAAAAILAAIGVMKWLS